MKTLRKSFCIWFRLSWTKHGEPVGSEDSRKSGWEATMLTNHNRCYTMAYNVSNRIAVIFRGNIVEMGQVEDVLVNPKHPYTRLLLESIPEPDPSKRREERIVFLEEREEYLRAGCKFAGRCPEAWELCGREMPQKSSSTGFLCGATNG